MNVYPHQSSEFVLVFGTSVVKFLFKNGYHHNLWEQWIARTSERERLKTELNFVRFEHFHHLAQHASEADRHKSICQHLYFLERFSHCVMIWYFVSSNSLFWRPDRAGLLTGRSRCRMANTGVVKFFLEDKGFGFISPSLGGPAITFHWMGKNSHKFRFRWFATVHISPY